MLLTDKPLANIVEANITRVSGGSKEQLIGKALFWLALRRLSFPSIHEIGMGPQKGKSMDVNAARNILVEGALGVSLWGKYQTQTCECSSGYSQRSRDIPLVRVGSPCIYLIITHKFLEPPAERIAKAEIISGLFNTTWLVTMARKSVPKDVGNDKAFIQERCHVCCRHAQ